ncbi:hypothetical protein DM860_011443 [Cuscuta australis]|uniref:Ribosomal protein L7Ae/L30e/S12e/Gadd45 domain-containing protein n=1 Tax=Cuscuta australis TaxID=267555 RepID=A0A328DTM3_9ASTE|nr:hypothetical protein DM860_011443 [Cuscuta australis]
MIDLQKDEEESARRKIESEKKVKFRRMLVIISNNCPPLWNSEIEYYAMLSKVGVHHYRGSDSDILKSMPGDQ